MGNNIEAISPNIRPATRLTQLHRREATGNGMVLAPALPPPPREFLPELRRGNRSGPNLLRELLDAPNTVGLIKAAQHGELLAQSDQVQGRRADTQRRHATAKAGWRPSDLPAWLNQEVYLREIQPGLKGITLSVLALTLRISIPYAVDIRSGRRTPHPRHWQGLAQLVGISQQTAPQEPGDSGRTNA